MASKTVIRPILQSYNRVSVYQSPNNRARSLSTLTAVIVNKHAKHETVEIDVANAKYCSIVLFESMVLN